MAVSEAEMLEVFRRDRDRGIRLIFERWYRPLVLYADEYVEDLPVSEDIVQEFFVRLWREGYVGEVSARALSSYLFTSVRNACYTYCHSREGRVRKTDLTGVDVAAECAEGMAEQVVERVTEAIAKLPGQTAAVCREVLLNDRKYQEAADVLQVSVNTVKTLLKTGLRALRKELEEERHLLFYLFLQKNR